MIISLPNYTLWSFKVVCVVLFNDIPDFNCTVTGTYRERNNFELSKQP